LFRIGFLVQRNILFLLMSMVVLSPMAIDIYLSSMPQMAVELKANSSQIQSTISLFFFAVGLGQLFVGPVADKYGRKIVALVGLLLYCVSALGASLVLDIVHLQWLRFLQGLASCAVSVVIFSVVRDVYTYERSSKVYSYLNGVLSIVPAVAPILGSALAQYYGWRSTFVFMFVFSAAVFLVVAYCLPETLSQSNSRSSASSNLYSLTKFKRVLTNKSFVFYAFCVMAGLACILSYVSYAPIWLIQHLNVSQVTFSLLFGFNACLSIICCFLAPKWITVYGNRFMVGLGLLLMLVSGCLLVLLSLFDFIGLSGAVAFMMPVGFLSAGLALSIGPASAVALSSFADSAGTASAVLGFIQMTGAAIVISVVQQSDLIAPQAVSLVVFVIVIPLLCVMYLPKLSAWSAEK